MFQLKYLSSEARYEKSVKGIISYFKSSSMSKEYFLLPMPFKNNFVSWKYDDIFTLSLTSRFVC